MTPKDKAEMDQALALFPDMWWTLYSNCKEKGFTAEQAFQITRDYVLVSVQSMGKRDDIK